MDRYQPICPTSCPVVVIIKMIVTVFYFVTLINNCGICTDLFNFCAYMQISGFYISKHSLMISGRCMSIIKQAALLTERDNRLAHYFAVFWGLGLLFGAKSDVIFLLDDPDYF